MSDSPLFIPHISSLSEHTTSPIYMHQIYVSLVGTRKLLFVSTGASVAVSANIHCGLFYTDLDV